MKIKRFYSFLALFTLFWASGCNFSSSQKTAHLFLYSISEYTEDLEQISTGVYTVNETGNVPNKIYAVQSPQRLSVWFSPNGEKVVVLSWHPVDQPDKPMPGASYSLVTMDAGGKNAITWFQDLAVNSIACQFAAQFSEDGKRFLYITPASEDCQEYLLYTANPDGNEKIQIDQASQIQAEFSPQGDRLLVSRRVRDVANKKTTSEVYYVDVKGGEPQIVWSTQEAATTVSATYAGSKRVLLGVGSILTAEVELVLVSDDFKDKTSVAKFPGIRTIHPALSKDSRYIALGRQGENCNLFSVVNVSTGEIRDISCWIEYPFQFSSNGKYLLVSALGSYGDFSESGIDQMLLKPNGELIETLSPPDYIHLTFSPDGNRLAYWVRDPSSKETCLNIRDLETGKVTLLSRTCVPGSTNIPGGTDWK